MIHAAAATATATATATAATTIASPAATSAAFTNRTDQIAFESRSATLELGSAAPAAPQVANVCVGHYIIQLISLTIFVSRRCCERFVVFLNEHSLFGLRVVRTCSIHLLARIFANSIYLRRRRYPKSCLAGVLNQGLQNGRLALLIRSVWRDFKQGVSVSVCPNVKFKIDYNRLNILLIILHRRSCILNILNFQMNMTIFFTNIEKGINTIAN